MSQTAASVQSTLEVETTSEQTTLVTVLKKPKPQTLGDFPKAVQDLMPSEWNKEADVFSPVKGKLVIVGTISRAYLGIGCPTTTFQTTYNVGILPYTKRLPDNYFMWAILNKAALARMMIVHGVEPNSTSYALGRESPIYAALYEAKSAVLVEYLCMAGARLDITNGLEPIASERDIIWKKLQQSRPLLQWLYEAGQKRELTPAEQVLLQHAYFATATDLVTKQLVSIGKRHLCPLGVFEIVISYVCKFDPDLKKHLEQANYQVERSDVPVATVVNGQLEYDNDKESFTSLAEPLHELAKDYFEKTQSEREQKRQRRKAEFDALFARVAVASAKPITPQYQNHTAATAVISSNAEDNAAQRRKICNDNTCAIS